MNKRIASVFIFIFVGVLRAFFYAIIFLARRIFVVLLQKKYYKLNKKNTTS